MEYEWDKIKREANIAKHDVDIVYAALIFEGRTLQTQDRRHDYGEIRYKSIGLIDDVCYVVIHTERNGKTRLISAWEGGQRDRREYQTGVSG